MSHQELLVLINAWVERGWLRPLDQAFMRFLDELAPNSEPLFLLAAALASHQLGRGHSCLDLAVTLAEPDVTLSLPPEGEAGLVLPALPSKILRGQALAAWRQCVAASPLVAEGAGNTPLVLAGNRLYLRRYWRYEQQVATAIQARLRHPDAAPADLAERLEALFPLEESTFRPDWQKIACALAARGAFSVITGGPGTGKTTTVVRLLALLQGAARQGGRTLRIRLAAPTGKAAARLTESIGNALSTLPQDLQEGIPTEASTLHRLLGARIGTRHFRHHAGNPLHADWVVVDEASMIDLEMMAALLSALPPHARLVLLGDKDQLASVEAGAVMGELCREAGTYSAKTVAWIAASTGEDVSAWQAEEGLLNRQIALLRFSHRFKETSGIGQLALAVNAGDGAAVRQVWECQPPYPDIAQISLRGQNDPRLTAFAIEGGSGYFPAQPKTASVSPLGHGHYLQVLNSKRPPAGAAAEDYDRWAAEVLAAFDQFQLLCALRRGPWGVDGLNLLIADGLHQAGLIGQTRGWYEGRPVLVTRNDYSLGLMNGDIGIALRFPCVEGETEKAPPPLGGGFGERGRLRVVFRQGDLSIKQVLPSRLVDIETVYAMTVHKSQGSEFTHVALVLPDKPNPILTRELVYTGITRARSWFSLVSPDPAILPQAVARQVLRSGGLGEAFTSQPSRQPQ